MYPHNHAAAPNQGTTDCDIYAATGRRPDGNDSATAE
jgi:hypothetical protein